jgi:A/G-specific adenine glycosylase
MGPGRKRLDTFELRRSNLPSESDLAVFRQSLLRWFRRHGRRFPWRSKNAGTYARVISEILLQRTKAQRVGEFLNDFLKAYPSWRHLADATEGELQQLLQPLGLWRRRATSIVALAREMKRRHGRFPVSREELEALPGVGQYIANAILLFCHGEPQPLLDVNMARVLERNFGARDLVDIRYDPYLQALATKALSKTDPSNLNWAILDLAGLVCLSSEPLCRKCPLSSSCLFGRRRTTETAGPTAGDAIRVPKGEVTRTKRRALGAAEISQRATD